MTTVAIIQARMKSTRLPGKILHDLGGQTMLARVVHRARRSNKVDRVVVATSTDPDDDRTVSACDALGVDSFRGDEQDVLDRFYKAAEAAHADCVVRITSDCPLIDPELIDKTIHAFLDAGPDYASNILERTYPRGLDTEVMTMAALARTWSEAREPYQRAHVTPFIYQHPELFRLLSVKGDRDHSANRWTVDTEEDLEFVRAIYAHMGNGDDFSWREVLSLVEKNPALAQINRHIRQKELEKG